MGIKKFLAVVLAGLTTMIYANGNIMGYSPSYRPTPTDAQLDRLTHLSLFTLRPGTDKSGTFVPNVVGELWGMPIVDNFTEELFSDITSIGLNGLFSDIRNTVARAHAKGVKVHITIGGGGITGSFPFAIKPAYRQEFAENIAALVEEYNLDGVDIDWEFPGESGYEDAVIGVHFIRAGFNMQEEIDDFTEFMFLLKDALGSKALTFASGEFGLNNYPERFYDAVDYIMFMAYDQNWANPGEIKGSGHHADMQLIKDMSMGYLGKMPAEKLFMGVPFYSRQNNNWRNAMTYSEIMAAASDKAAASQSNSFPTTSPHPGTKAPITGISYYDGIPQIQEKVEFAHTIGTGGVMIWEIHHDVEPTNEYSLLSALYEKNKELIGASAEKHQFAVTFNTGGIVKNGATPVVSGTPIEVLRGGDLNFTFTPNAGYRIKDVKINGMSNFAARVFGIYSVINVRANQTLEVEFAVISSADESIDLANGNYQWGGSKWGDATFDVSVSASGVLYEAEINPGGGSGISAILPTGTNLNTLTGIEILYTSNNMMYLYLLSGNGNFRVALPATENGAQAFVLTDFALPEWANTGLPLDLSKVTEIHIGTGFENAAGEINISSLVLLGVKKPIPSAPAAPTLASKTTTSITLTANAAHEFSKDGTIWQTSNVFSDLTAYTDYTFYRRMAATATVNASAASAVLNVKTDCAHTYGDWTQKTAANCTAKKVEKANCTVCNHEITQSVGEILPHDYGEPVVVAATCTATGTSTRTCSVCEHDDVSVLAINAENHFDGCAHDPTSIKNAQKSNSKHGIKFAQNIVSDKAEISIILPNNEKISETKIAIYDMTGNIVFVGATAPGRPLIWDLTNNAGRFVANGTYLIIAEAKDRNGKFYAYSAKLGVKR